MYISNKKKYYEFKHIINLMISDMIKSIEESIKKKQIVDMNFILIKLEKFFNVKFRMYTF